MEKLMEHPDRGSMSCLIEDKDNRVKDEEERSLSWLVDFPKQHYGCAEDEPTLREIICQLNTDVNPELFCEKIDFFRAGSFQASKNISPIHWGQNGLLEEYQQQSFAQMPPEREDNIGNQDIAFCETTRNDSTQEEQRTHFPDVNTWLRRGSWMTFNSGVTNQWEEEERLEEMWEKRNQLEEQEKLEKNRKELEEEEKLEEIWEKSNQWEERLEKGREELEEEEEKLEKSKEYLEEEEENRERSEKSVSKGQLVGRTKYTSISEVPDHLDLDLEVGGGRSVENRPRLGFKSKMTWYLSMVKERMESLVKVKMRSKLRQRSHSKKGVQCNFCKTLHFSSSSDSTSSSGSSSSSKQEEAANAKLEIFEDQVDEKVVGMPAASCSFKMKDIAKYKSKDMDEILKSESGCKTDQDNKFHQKKIRANSRLPGWEKSQEERKVKKKRKAILHQPRKCK